MAKYEILLRQSVLKKDLPKLPKADVQKIMEAIRSLSDTLRPPGIQKLSREERYRIQRSDYRIIFSIQDAERTIWIAKVGHRRDVYK